MSASYLALHLFLVVLAVIALAYHEIDERILKPREERRRREAERFAHVGRGRRDQ